MAQNAPIHPIRPGPDIPDKLYFRIGDVAKLCDVPTYVLRFWEVEFPQLKPNKGGTGQRLYRRRDVEMALRVKRLLYDEGYTIPGARQVLKQEQRGGTAEPQLALAIEQDPSSPVHDLRRLQLLRKDLEDLHLLLSRPAASPRLTVQSIRSARGPRLAPPLPPRAFSVPMNDLFEETLTPPESPEARD